MKHALLLLVGLSAIVFFSVYFNDSLFSIVVSSSTVILLMLLAYFFFFLSQAVTKEHHVVQLPENDCIEKIMDAYPYAVVSTDERGIIKLLNKEAEATFQYTKEEVIGHHVKMLSSSYSRFIKRYLRTSNEKVVNTNHKAEIKRKDNKKISLSLSLREVDFEGQKLFLGIFREPDSNCYSEADLESAREKAEQATRAKSLFLAAMSHEIRTPLNSIVGVAELLELTPLTKRQQKYLSILNASSNMLLMLINDILDFSKIEADEIKLEVLSTNLEPLILDAFKLQKSVANKKKLDLVFKMDPHIPKLLLIDPLRFTQVVLNLFNNAVKFTDTGYVVAEVSLVAQNVKTKKATICVVVKDTGVGVPEEKLPTIFDHFTQSDDSTTRKYGGTGLGLAISKRLVTMMRGTINAKNNAEMPGTEFWFNIEVGYKELEAEPPLSPIAFQHRVMLYNPKQHIAMDALAYYLNDSKITYTECSDFVDLSEMTEDDVLIAHHSDCITSESFKEMLSQYDILPRLIVIAPHENNLYALGYPCQLLEQPFTASTVHNVLNSPAVVEKDERQIVQSLGKPQTKYFANVLLVEDYIPNQKILNEMLTSLGVNVEIVGNGEAALHILAKAPEHFELVFMDCQMPEMDGYQATEMIRSHEWGKSLPIIAITANAFQDDKERCLSIGMNDYIAKPVRRKELIRVLEKYTSGYKDVSNHEKYQPVSLPENPEEVPTKSVMAHFGLSSEKQAQYFEEDMETIRYVLSHDLGDPLRQLEKVIPQDSDAQDLTKLLEQRQNALMEFIQLGMPTIKMKPFDFNEVMNSVIEKIKAQYPKEKLDIRLEHMPETLIARKQHIEKLFYYLLDNAVKFNTQPTRLVMISCQEEPDCYHFSIEDNGIGIDEEFYQIIFILFQRAEEVKDTYPGIGAGLALAQRVIHAHGGDIEVSSSLGEGSTFDFTLKKVEQENEREL